MMMMNGGKREKMKAAIDVDVVSCLVYKISSLYRDWKHEIGYRVN